MNAKALDRYGQLLKYGEQTGVFGPGPDRNAQAVFAPRHTRPVADNNLTVNELLENGVGIIEPDEQEIRV